MTHGRLDTYMVLEPSAASWRVKELVSPLVSP
jgi:hypothetical protein